MIFNKFLTHKKYNSNLKDYKFKIYGIQFFLISLDMGWEQQRCQITRWGIIPYFPPTLGSLLMKHNYLEHSATKQQAKFPSSETDDTISNSAWIKTEVMRVRAGNVQHNVYNKGETRRDNACVSIIRIGTSLNP